MNYYTIRQNGQTIGVFASTDEATEYAAREMHLAASVDVDHGDHIRTYLYASREAMDADEQGQSPAAVVIPCDADHIPVYRA